MMKKLIYGIIVILFIGSGIALAEPTLNTAPNIPTDPHPEDGAIDVGMRTHLSWTGGDPDDGDRATYDLYFGIEQDPVLLASDLEMPHFKPDTLEANTQYYWKVIARDEDQETSEGPVWSFTTNDCDCDPPDQPSGPSRAKNRSRYEYTTKLMVQNQNGLYYNFSWGDGNCSGWLGPYDHNERVRAEHQWQESGEYQVQVQARFRNNGTLSYNDWITTGWSEPLLVTVTSENIENEMPESPTITGTNSGKAGVEYEYTFSATDPDGDNVYIYVEFCADCEENQWYGPYASGYQLTLSHTWESQGNYQVKSKVKDIFDAESEWATLEVVMPRSDEVVPLPSGNGIMQRLRNRFCDTLGICQGGCDLTTLSGILSFDGVNFFIDGVELHFGPRWYLISAESVIDYDKDGSLELIFNELQGLIGTEITIEGHQQSDQWVSVFTINGEVYREPGQPIWASQHQFQWRNHNGPNKP
jgi:hypothetical protein